MARFNSPTVGTNTSAKQDQTSTQPDADTQQNQNSDNDLAKVIADASADEDLIERRIERPKTKLGEPLVVYKHRLIRSFHVSEFHFVNHLLFIYTEEENEKWLEYYDGLMDIDKNAIVIFNFKAAANLEQPIKPVGVMRGSLSTKGIPDQKIVK